MKKLLVPILALSVGAQAESKGVDDVSMLSGLTTLAAACYMGHKLSATTSNETVSFLGDFYDSVANEYYEAAISNNKDVDKAALRAMIDDTPRNIVSLNQHPSHLISEVKRLAPSFLGVDWIEGCADLITFWRMVKL